MTSQELLSPQDHGQVRLLPRVGMEPHFVEIVPGEFVAAAMPSEDLNAFPVRIRIPIL